MVTHYQAQVITNKFMVNGELSFDNSLFIYTKSTKGGE